jgi:hypothetical protein
MEIYSETGWHQSFLKAVATMSTSSEEHTLAVALKSQLGIIHR